VNPPLLLFGKGIADQQIWVSRSNLDGSWNPWTPIASKTNVSPAAVNFKNKVLLFGKGLEDRRVYCQVSPQGT
jgi:hypothetical protein